MKETDFYSPRGTMSTAGNITALFKCFTKVVAEINLIDKHSQHMSLKCQIFFLAKTYLIYTFHLDGQTLSLWSINSTPTHSSFITQVPKYNCLKPQTWSESLDLVCVMSPCECFN